MVFSTIGKCSTPFGITEVGMPRPDQKPKSHIQCSTPFGITEVGMFALSAQ